MLCFRVTPTVGEQLTKGSIRILSIAAAIVVLPPLLFGRMIEPAYAQQEPFCRAVKQLISQHRPKKYRSLKTKKLDGVGNAISNLTLPGMDECVVFDVSDVHGFSCHKLLPTADEQDAQYEQWKTQIAACYPSTTPQEREEKTPQLHKKRVLWEFEYLAGRMHKVELMRVSGGRHNVHIDVW
jgi:hypothetical protein